MSPMTHRGNRAAGCPVAVHWLGINPQAFETCSPAEEIHGLEFRPLLLLRALVGSDLVSCLFFLTTSNRARYKSIPT